jgi:putative flippase GtrA
MIEGLFRAPAEKVSVQVFRYVLAGTMAYAVDCSMLIVLTSVLGLYYLTSAAIAFLLGMVTSYVLNVVWVFNEGTIKIRRMEMVLFFSIGIAGLFLNHFCIRFFTESAHLHYLASKFISTMIVFVVNFSSRKYLLSR